MSEGQRSNEISVTGFFASAAFGDLSKQAQSKCSKRCPGQLGIYKSKALDKKGSKQAAPAARPTAGMQRFVQEREASTAKAAKAAAEQGTSASTASKLAADHYFATTSSPGSSERKGKQGSTSNNKRRAEMLSAAAIASQTE